MPFVNHCLMINAYWCINIEYTCTYYIRCILSINKWFTQMINIVFHSDDIVCFLGVAPHTSHLRVAHLWVNTCTFLCAEASGCRLFSALPEDLQHALCNEPTTANYHNYGITPEVCTSTSTSMCGIDVQRLRFEVTWVPSVTRMSSTCATGVTATACLCVSARRWSPRTARWARSTACSRRTARRPAARTCRPSRRATCPCMRCSGTRRPTTSTGGSPGGTTCTTSPPSASRSTSPTSSFRRVKR